MARAANFQYADPEEVASLAADLPNNFLECRDLAHYWKAWTVTWSKETRTYERTLRCSRCKMFKIQELNATAMVLNTRYRPPRGYYFHVGILAADSRAALRLVSLQRQMLDARLQSRTTNGDEG